MQSDSRRHNDTTANDLGGILLAALWQDIDSDNVKHVWRSVAGLKGPTTSKTFKDVTYQSIPERGISLQFECRECHAGLQCQSIDIYNAEAQIKGWSAFAGLPLDFDVIVDDERNTNKDAKPKQLRLDVRTTGTDLVTALGEPSRKGGGASSASGLGPGAWMEWKLKLVVGNPASSAMESDDATARVAAATPSTSADVKFMIQLAGADARGPQRWDKDKGGASRWGVLMIYV